MTKAISLLLGVIMLIVGAFSASFLMGGAAVPAAREETAENTEWDAGENEENADEGYVIDLMFDGTYWESGDLQLGSIWQDGNYKVTITGGEAELSYLCTYDDVVIDDVTVTRLTGIGAGDEETTAAQPDHGIATFLYNFMTEELIWRQADGQETVFKRIIDPLDDSRWFVNGLTATIRWLGGSDYEVYIERMFFSWIYQCTLDETSDVLTGTGIKTHYGDDVYTDATATFVLRNARREMVWTDDKEQEAINGLAFEAVARDVAEAMWSDDTYSLFMMWSEGYYDVHVYSEAGEHAYLCTYDWDTNTLTALDPAEIPFDSMNLYLDQALYTGTGSFVLEDDTTLVWHDDSGLAGDGIALKKF